MIKEIFGGHKPSHFHINPLVRALILSDTILWAGWNLISPIFAIFVTQDIAGGSVEIAASAFSTHLLSRVLLELISGKFLAKSTTRTKFLVTTLGIALTGLAFFGFSFAAFLAR